MRGWVHEHGPTLLRVLVLPSSPAADRRTVAGGWLVSAAGRRTLAGDQHARPAPAAGARPGPGPRLHAAPHRDRQCVVAPVGTPDGPHLCTPHGRRTARQRTRCRITYLHRRAHLSDVRVPLRLRHGAVRPIARIARHTRTDRRPHAAAPPPVAPGVRLRPRAAPVQRRHPGRVRPDRTHSGRGPLPPLRQGTADHRVDLRGRHPALRPGKHRAGAAHAPAARRGAG